MAYRRYEEAISRWKPESGGFPCYAMYLFCDEEGNRIEKGYVASTGDSHYLADTKKEAIARAEQRHS